MHVRIIRGRLKPGTWDRYEEAFKTILCAEAVPGLQSRWLLRDETDPDAGYSMSVWDDEAAMEAYEANSALRDRLFAAMQDVFTGEYSAQQCELRVRHDFPSSSGRVG